MDEHLLVRVTSQNRNWITYQYLSGNWVKFQKSCTSFFHFRQIKENVNSSARDTIHVNSEKVSPLNRFHENKKEDSDKKRDKEGKKKRNAVIYAKFMHTRPLGTYRFIVTAFSSPFHRPGRTWRTYCTITISRTKTDGKSDFAIKNNAAFDRSLPFLLGRDRVELWR